MYETEGTKKTILYYWKRRFMFEMLYVDCLTWRIFAKGKCIIPLNHEYARKQLIMYTNILAYSVMSEIMHVGIKLWTPKINRRQGARWPCEFACQGFKVVDWGGEEIRTPYSCNGYENYSAIFWNILGAEEHLFG